MSALSELARVLKRLEASDTPRKRKTALLAFAHAVKALEAAVAQQYPKLRQDGTPIIRRKVRGCRCPACKLPMQSFGRLARHMAGDCKAHQVSAGDCWCGKEFQSYADLARHLAHVRDLEAHYVPYAMLQWAAEERGGKP